jgi:hypothetical protein
MGLVAEACCGLKPLNESAFPMMAKVLMET